MHNRSDRCLNSKRYGIRDTVVHANEFYGKTANPENGSGFLCKYLCIIKKIMLFQFQLDQGCCQRCCINRDIQFLQHIRNRADMIFMSVGDDQAADAARVISEICNIWQDNINPVHVLIRKPHTAIYQ